MAVIAMIVIGWYAIRVLPSSLPQKQSAPTETQNVVRVDPTDPVRGLANASHTIIEFGDMECPTCGSLDPQIADLVKQNPDVRLVWKDCPSSSHPNAEAAAEGGGRWVFKDLPKGKYDLVIVAKGRRRKTRISWEPIFIPRLPPPFK